jgi:cytochrome c oxidase subunit II
MPDQASSLAGQHDLIFWFINAVTILFSVGIFVALIFFSVRYRRGRQVDRSNAPLHNNVIEVIWTIVPFAIVMAIFAASTSLYLQQRTMPNNALEIHVVGKQWMWKLQHPTGRWENNELHVPRGRPVRLIMTSEDVLHAFYIPAFRNKADVIPGQYTHMWFTPTKVGVYPLYCAEFCGTLHSQMVGTVTVMEPADYERWLNEGRTSETMASLGARLFVKNGCSGCHAGNSSVRAPSLEGLYGRSNPVQIPQRGVPLERTPATQVVADDRYIYDSIVLPEKEIAAGYQRIMPTYKNRISEAEIFQLTAYIKSLGREQPNLNRRVDRSERLGPDEYRARVGFEPPSSGGTGGGGRGGSMAGGIRSGTASGGRGPSGGGAAGGRTTGAMGAESGPTPPVPSTGGGGATGGNR